MGACNTKDAITLPTSPSNIKNKISTSQQSSNDRPTSAALQTQSTTTTSNISPSKTILFGENITRYYSTNKSASHSQCPSKITSFGGNIARYYSPNKYINDLTNIKMLGGGRETDVTMICLKNQHVRQPNSTTQMEIDDDISNSDVEMEDMDNNKYTLSDISPSLFEHCIDGVNGMLFDDDIQQLKESAPDENHKYVINTHNNMNKAEYIKITIKKTGGMKIKHINYDNQYTETFGENMDWQWHNCSCGQSLEYHEAKNEMIQCSHCLCWSSDCIPHKMKSSSSESVLTKCRSCIQFDTSNPYDIISTNADTTENASYASVTQALERNAQLIIDQRDEMARNVQKVTPIPGETKRVKIEEQQYSVFDNTFEPMHFTMNRDVALSVFSIQKIRHYFKHKRSMRNRGRDIFKLPPYSKKSIICDVIMDSVYAQDPKCDIFPPHICTKDISDKKVVISRGTIEVGFGCRRHECGYLNEETNEETTTISIDRYARDVKFYAEFTAVNVLKLLDDKCKNIPFRIIWCVGSQCVHEVGLPCAWVCINHKHAINTKSVKPSEVTAAQMSQVCRKMLLCGTMRNVPSAESARKLKSMKKLNDLGRVTGVTSLESIILHKAQTYFNKNLKEYGYDIVNDRDKLRTMRDALNTIHGPSHNPYGLTYCEQIQSLKVSKSIKNEILAKVKIPGKPIKTVAKLVIARKLFEGDEQDVFSQTTTFFSHTGIIFKSNIELVEQPDMEVFIADNAAYNPSLHNSERKKMNEHALILTELQPMQFGRRGNASIETFQGYNKFTANHQKSAIPEAVEARIRLSTQTLVRAEMSTLFPNKRNRKNKKKKAAPRLADCVSEHSGDDDLYKDLLPGTYNRKPKYSCIQKLVRDVMLKYKLNQNELATSINGWDKGNVSFNVTSAWISSIMSSKGSLTTPKYGYVYGVLVAMNKTDGPLSQLRKSQQNNTKMKQKAKRISKTNAKTKTKTITKTKTKPNVVSKLLSVFKRNTKLARFFS